MTAPFCKDCVHVERDWLGRVRPLPLCLRPTGEIDLVTGEPVLSLLGAGCERSCVQGPYCGPTGKFFTSRTSRTSHEEHRA